MMADFDKEIAEFGERVVRNSYLQAVEVGLREARKLGLDSEDLRKVVETTAEAALASFFSNHALVGSFEISIRTEDDSFFDLFEEFGAALIVAFDKAGWLARRRR